MSHLRAHTHSNIHTHLKSALVEEPVGESYNIRGTPVVDKQLRVVGRYAQLSEQFVEAHKKRHRQTFLSWYLSQHTCHGTHLQRMESSMHNVCLE